MQGQSARASNLDILTPMNKRSLAALAITTLLAAQIPPPAGTPEVPGARGSRGGAPQKPTYVVHPDRTVTFELRAPDATTSNSPATSSRAART
jgi:hypothetical protein